MCIYNCTLLQNERRGSSLGSLLGNLAYLLGSTVEILVVVDAELLLLALDELLGLLGVRALQAQHNGLGKLVSLVGLDNRLGKTVAAEDASKDIDKNGLHIRIIIQQF